MISFGSEVSHEQLGWIADFCPVCQKIRAHQVITTRWYDGRLGIRLSEERVRSRSPVCSTCEAHGCTPLGEHDPVAENYNGDLDSLIGETRPSVRKVYAKELELAGRVEALSSTEHKAALRDRLTVLNRLAEYRSEGLPVSKSGRIALGVAAIGFCWFLAMRAFDLEPPIPEDLDFGISMSLFGLLMIFPFLALLYAMLSTRPWHPKRRFRAQVRRALRPLDPTVEQLETALPPDVPRAERVATARRLYHWIQ